MFFPINADGISLGFRNKPIAKKIDIRKNINIKINHGELVALVGPAATIISTGNLYKASAQFMIDHSIKKKTGKHSISFVKDEIEKKEIERNLNKELRLLVEKRIKITRKKLDLQKINQ